jgi:hypothetical protein
MDEELAVIVTGFDVDQRRAEAGLMGVFGLDAARARRFVRELPAVAKTCGNRGAADRYAQALRSIGARVEIQSAASAAAEGRPSPSSLPIPAPSIMARLDESTRVERETLRAIERFRAAEGLDAAGEPPLDLDPINPSIPRAPPVPHDLAKMPNAKLPRWSERPAWMMTDPLEQGERSDPSGTQSPRPHNDAKPPPPPATPVRLLDSTAASRAAHPRAGQPEPSRSMRPSAVGLAHAAKASVRPGIGLLSWWRIAGRDARRRRLRQAWLTAVALVVLMAGALWLWGFR